MPLPDPHKRRTQTMPTGEMPNPINPPYGCRFHPRFPIAQEICSRVALKLCELRPGNQAAGHFAEQFL